jgi:hypothetical protein
LGYGTLRNGVAANVEYDPDYWPPYDVTVTVDANNGNLVQYVIHELLHVVFGPLIAGSMDETLEEVVIVALEAYMIEYVKKSKTRYAKWSSLIEKKLAESLADAPAIPLEELVDRT